MALINPFRSSKKLDTLKSQIQSLGPDFQVTGGLQDPPTENAIAAAESQLAVKFNPEYRDMLKWAGHLVIEVSENVWPRARDGFVGPAWTFGPGFRILGSGSGIPDSLDVAKNGTNSIQRLGSPVVPFLRWVYSTDYLCFDQNGRVFEWRWQGPFTRLSEWTGWKEEGIIFYYQSNPMYQAGRETFELAGPGARQCVGRCVAQPCRSATEDQEAGTRAWPVGLNKSPDERAGYRNAGTRS